MDIKKYNLIYNIKFNLDHLDNSILLRILIKIDFKKYISILI